MAQLLPELTADWKVIRRLADAIAEVADEAVQTVVDDLHLHGTEDELDDLLDRVISLATTGDEPK